MSREFEAAAENLWTDADDFEEKLPFNANGAPFFCLIASGLRVYLLSDQTWICKRFGANLWLGGTKRLVTQNEPRSRAVPNGGRWATGRPFLFAFHGLLHLKRFTQGLPWATAQRVCGC